MSNLALTMRPTQLSEVLGNESVKRSIQHFVDKADFPNVFLFSGPPGTGKTTLAEIVAREAGADDSCTHQVNGSDKNGVDDARELAEKAQSSPLNGQRRVFIINEAQRMTSPAMECLLEPMEKTQALWLLTSTDPQKIIPAIKSRASAATFNLQPLKKSEIFSLVYSALPGSGDSANAERAEKFATWFVEKNVTAPREILGVLDQILSGVPPEQAIHGAEYEPLYHEVGGAVLRGDWAKTSSLLAQIKTADSRGMISIVSAFLRSEILKNPIGPRADALATCLVGVDSLGFADGTAYGAVTGLLYKTCKALGGVK